MSSILALPPGIGCLDSLSIQQNHAATGGAMVAGFTIRRARCRAAAPYRRFELAERRQFE
jgi:hypothetical protein